MDWRWTNDEFEAYLKAMHEKSIGWYSLDSLAKEIAKVNKKGQKDIKDSLVLDYERKGEAYAGKNKLTYQVDYNIILTIGKLGIREAEPILRKVLLDTVHYNTTYVEYALARLGDKSLEAKIIAESRPDINKNGEAWYEDYTRRASKLVYVNTQESIYSLNEWMDTSKTEVQYLGRTPVKVKVGAEVYKTLYYLLDNNREFKRDEWISAYNILEMESAMILAARKWLEENKGNYNSARKIRISA